MRNTVLGSGEKRKGEWADRSSRLPNSPYDVSLGGVSGARTDAAGGLGYYYTVGRLWDAINK